MLDAAAEPMSFEPVIRSQTAGLRRILDQAVSSTPTRKCNVPQYDAARSPRIWA